MAGDLDLRDLEGGLGPGRRREAEEGGGQRDGGGAGNAAAEAGVKAVIQPGGSVRDPEVIAAADERGLTMVFTGQRLFRH